MKRNVKKKIIVGIVTMLLVLTYFTITNTSNAEDVLGTWDISADDGKSNVTATLYSDGNLIISGTGDMKNYIYSNLRAPYIQKKEKIEKVIIENGITAIGVDAFIECENITNVEISDSVTTINSESFKGCKNLININIPNSVTSIKDWAFQNCTSLANIEISNSINRIGRGVFSGCTKIENIEIPDSVEIIEDFAFSGCSNLKKIIISENNQNYISIDGVLYNKDKTSIECYPNGKEETEYIILEGVTNIKKTAFYESTNLISIKIPNNVTTIEESAFGYCTSLTNIEIPNSVTTIGFGTFRNCTSLIDIEIPNGVTNIRQDTFAGCSNLRNIVIPEGVVEIDSRAFSKCNNLTTINIPSNVEYIGENAFQECGKLDNIFVMQNNNYYKDIDGILFTKDGTKIIKYPEGKKSTIYIIPQGVTDIRRNAFEGCNNLENIKIPNSVTSIEKHAFEECTSLTNIEIPDSVTSIDYFAFFGCTNLKEVGLGNGISCIKMGLFQNCKSIEKIRIPENVTSIEYCAFYQCESLTQVLICNKVTSIHETAFWQCGKLTIYTNSDYVKNYAENNNKKYIVDIAGPDIVEEKNVSTWTNSDVKVTITVTDDIVRVREVYIDDKLIKLEDDKIFIIATKNKRYHIVAKDNLGNVIEKTLIIDNIDKEKPVIEKVEGNSSSWTKENVTLKVIAKDTISGIKEYSFDGGTTWQESNEKTYSKNTENIVIKVRDNAGNITEYEPISITKIMKLEKIEIRKEPTKIEYIEGEKFNVAGMKIVAIYDNNTEEEITKYTITNGNNLEPGQESVTVRYKEGEIIKETTQKITIAKKTNLNLEDYQAIQVDEKKYIEKIKEGTTIKELKEKIKTNGTIEIYKGSNKVTGENEVIGTGMAIKVKINNQEEIYEAVVIGDLTGDGNIKMADLLKLARYKAGIDKNLSGAYLRAGDVVKDGKIGMPDILKLSRVLAGMENL